MKSWYFNIIYIYILLLYDKMNQSSGLAVYLSLSYTRVHHFTQWHQWHKCRISFIFLVFSTSVSICSSHTPLWGACCRRYLRKPTVCFFFPFFSSSWSTSIRRSFSAWPTRFPDWNKDNIKMVKFSQTHVHTVNPYILAISQLPVY